MQRGPLEQQETQASLGIEVKREILEPRVQLVIRVQQDNLAHLGCRDLKAIVDHKVRLAKLLLRDHQGHLDPKGLVETTEIQVQLVMREHQDLQEIQEEMVGPEQLGELVNQDLLVYQGWLEVLDHQVLKES